MSGEHVHGHALVNAVWSGARSAFADDLERGLAELGLAPEAAGPGGSGETSAGTVRVKIVDSGFGGR